MSLTEFLEQLKATPRDWTISHGLIRRQAMDGVEWECPITALTHEPCRNVYESAGKLGLGRMITGDIIAAADDGILCEELLRSQLIEACGIK